MTVPPTSPWPSCSGLPPRTTAALDAYGSGNTGSRFLNGNLDLHYRLEAELADLLATEAALVFSTGYQTNLGTLGALIGRADTVYIDKLDQASVQDGARLGLGRVEVPSTEARYFTGLPRCSRIGVRSLPIT